MNLDGIGFVEAIVVDVSDLAKGAAFWGAVTGKEFGPSFEPNFLRARSESGLDLVLQEVADFKTGKNRMHLSLSHKPGSVSDIVNKSHLVAITDSNLCVLRQLSSSL